jgi:hypothetical protein
MSGDHDVGRRPISARWRVAAAVLTTVLAAAACTNRGGIQQPTTSIQTTGVPFDPSLSPDGRRVVFRTSRGRYAPDPDGTGIRSLPELQGAGDPIDWLARVG